MLSLKIIYAQPMGYFQIRMRGYHYLLYVIAAKNNLFRNRFQDCAAYRQSISKIQLAKIFVLYIF